MLESYEIVSSSGRYSVTLGQNLLGAVIERRQDAIYVIDAVLADRLPAHVEKRIVIEADEANKALESMPAFVAELRRLGGNRDTHLVAIGGGILQDIATFLASIYMRGIPWTYMPTTVLSMADSCIGGKSSVNVLGYKNLIGNFYPPSDVAIDLDFITTLDAEMIVGGLFEAAKICFAFGPERFSEYLAARPDAKWTPERLQPTVGLALATKKWFIETDEFDQKERLLLNFGHTFGHAIEAATDFGVSHGIGVGIGMLVACELAAANDEPNEAGRPLIDSMRQHVVTMLGIGSAAVVAAPPVIDIVAAMQKFEYDKKHRAGAYRVVIPDRDGRLVLASLPRDASTRDMVAMAYRKALDSIGWRYEWGPAS